MKKTEILIIGGGPAGVVLANTARKNFPLKDITLIRKHEIEVIPCGIPYVFHRLEDVEANIMPDTSLEANHINLIIGEVEEVDSNEKTVLIKNQGSVSYEKMILATGSKPVIVPIKGVEKRGVWHIKKDFEYLKKLRIEVLKSQHIVIVGGGFIGVELAEELSHIKNLKISIIEREPTLFSTSFDQEFADVATNRLIDKGVSVFTNTTLEEIGGEEKVEFVHLSGQGKIDADLVVLSIGAKPNVELAQSAGISVGDFGGIDVDEYMRTNVTDILAIGDCVEKKDFFTRKHIAVMLASTATSEARIAADNLYQLKVLRENKGTVAAFATYVDGLVFGCAGLTEKTALNENFDIVIGRSESPNHHPGKLPNTKKISVKLIFSKTSGDLLGGQVMGPESISEMINIIALAVQKGVTAAEFDTLQIATHPLITAAPTVYPLITAAKNALFEMCN